MDRYGRPWRSYHDDEEREGEHRRAREEPASPYWPPGPYGPMPGHASDEPRRWPERVHAPWEDLWWWEQQAHDYRYHPDHHLRERMQRFFAGLRGPHRGKGPKGYRRSDERIREDVCDRIAHWGWVDASDVEVRVTEGEVTLSGHVDSRADKRLLEDMIEHVPGVRDVHNQVRIRREPERRDAPDMRARTS